MYRLKSWFPDGKMGGSGFNIILTPKWKEAVAKSEINQEGVDNIILNLGNDILKGHGRATVDKHMLFCSLRISWGEWGPEHITVPGNACGLDIDTRCPGCLPDEVPLTPHNVDSISQASMLLTIFIRIAEILEAEAWMREHITKDMSRKNLRDLIQKTIERERVYYSAVRGIDGPYYISEEVASTISNMAYIYGQQDALYHILDVIREGNDIHELQEYIKAKL